MDHELRNLHQGAREERRNLVPDPEPGPPAESDGGGRTHTTTATCRGCYCGGRCFKLPGVANVESHEDVPGWDGWTVHGIEGEELYLSERYFHEPQAVDVQGTAFESVLPVLPAWDEERNGGP